MISFESDYIAGAHPRILQRLVDTNLEALSGYGTDRYTESAKEKIRAACCCPQAQVEFLTGGTQTNAVVISTMLRDYEGVIAADSGHISTHEAGAVEGFGHKVLTLPGRDGKLDPRELRDFVSAFYADENREHMVFPGMVYLSHPTEYGTLYTREELAEIAAISREYGMRLYLDGARLIYGLAARNTDVTLPDLAGLCDVFYIGGTKAGTLCGEAVVFPRGNRPAHFTTSVKKRGALLAKGRLCGVQFDALFSDGLYEHIGRHAIDMAERMKEIFREAGFRFRIDSPTNQIFPILENQILNRLKEEVKFSFWERFDEAHTVVRFATSWSTTEADLEGLKNIFDKI